MTRRAPIVVTLALMLAALRSPGLRAEGVSHAGNLSGTWKLNHDLSDDPRKGLEMRSSGGAPHGSRSGFRGGRRGGGYGRSMHGEDGGESGARFLDPEAIETLTIAHHDPELRISDAVGHEHVLFTDDRKVEEERSAGAVKMRAKWKDGHVVVTTTPEHGPKIVETYSVAADGSVLTVTSKIEGGRGDFEFHRVYDAVR